MFPFSENIELGQREKAHYKKVLEHIYPLLTIDRRQKIERVVVGRNFRHAVVMENIYDRGNTSAVVRSAEAFGLANVHVIETFDKFKESQRTTAGADKWVELNKWKSTAEFVQAMKKQGKQIIVTHLDASSKPLDEIDFTQDSAIVLGNEKDGASAEMIAAADHRVIIPMAGFVQSFNISVAGALCFYQLAQREKQLLKHRQSYLSETEIEILKAVYAVRTLDSATDILKAKGVTYET